MKIEKMSEIRDSLLGGEFIHTTFSPDEDSPFPLEVLPLKLRRFAEHLSEQYQAPIDLVAPQTLGIISTCLGRGIKLITNHPDPTYGLIYLFLATRPGVSKSTILNFLVQPLREFQSNVRKANRVEVESNLMHEQVHKKTVHATKEWKPTKKEIDDEIGKAVPTLIVEHYSQEGLATTLSHNEEYLALLSSDVSGVIDMLRGSKSGGHHQGEILLKGYSGDSYDCNNKVATNEHLEEIRLAINWLGTIDTLKLFIGDPQIKGRGLLSRFCFAEIHDLVQPSQIYRRQIDDSMRSWWKDFLFGLLSQFWRQNFSQTLQVSMSDDALQACVNFRNEYVTHQESLLWLDSLPERWAENALRFALILHVSKHPNAAQDHVLNEETMQGAISVMKWFVGREIASMEEVRKSGPEINECKARVFDFLKKNGPTKIRDFDKKRKILKRENRHLLNMWVKNGHLVMWDGSGSNAPSPRVAIAGDDRIPEGVELITNP